MAGFVLSMHTAAGPVSDWGFRLLSLAWVWTTITAWLRIMRGEVSRHREWMIRSYALTLAAVMLRIQLFFGLLVIGATFDTTYAVAAWGCWVVNLLIAQWWIGRTRRVSAAS